MVKTVVNSGKKKPQDRIFLGFFGGDGGESNSPSKQAIETICYRLIRRFYDAPATPIGGVSRCLLAGSWQPLACCPSYHSLTLLRPLPTHQAEVGRTRVTGF